MAKPGERLIWLPFGLGTLCLGFACFMEIVGLLFFGPATALNHPPMFNLLGDIFLYSFQVGALCLIVGLAGSILKGLIMLFQKLEQLSIIPEEECTEAPTETLQNIEQAQ